MRECADTAEEKPGACSRKSPEESRCMRALTLARRSGAESSEWRGGREQKDNRIVPVAMRLGATPVPIPNTMVKTQAADDTALETVWESRWLPESQKGLIAQPVRAHA